MEEQANYGDCVPNVRLGGDRIAIKLFHVIPESSLEDRGIILPTKMKPKEMEFFKYSKNPYAGMVFYVGDGIVGDHITTMPYKAGDIVVLEKVSATISFDNGRMIVTPDGEEYYIARRSEIMFAITNDKDFNEAERYYNSIKAKNYE